MTSGIEIRLELKDKGKGSKQKHEVKEEDWVSERICGGSDRRSTWLWVRGKKI